MQYSTVLLLFIVLSLVYPAVPTLFKATGTLTCSHHKHYCFLIQMMERDSVFSGNDPLDEKGVFCMPGHSNEYQLMNVTNGDEVFSRTYDLYFVVTHNCTRNGKKMRFEKIPQYVHLNESEVIIQWDKELYNKGESVHEWS